MIIVFRCLSVNFAKLSQKQCKEQEWFCGVVDACACIVVVTDAITRSNLAVASVFFYSFNIFFLNLYSFKDHPGLFFRM